MAQRWRSAAHRRPDAARRETIGRRHRAGRRGAESTRRWTIDNTNASAALAAATAVFASARLHDKDISRKLATLHLGHPVLAPRGGVAAAGPASSDAGANRSGAASRGRSASYTDHKPAHCEGRLTRLPIRLPSYSGHTARGADSDPPWRQI